MQESSLHSDLKKIYAVDGDQQEAWVDGYLVDILHGDQVIEIQTRNFFALKQKIKNLLENHPVRLVHPIAREKWITRTGAGIETRRRSPRRGRPEDLFYELVSLAHLVNQPGFTLEIVMARIEEIRVNDGRGSWRRRGWSIHDRKLDEIIERYIFTTPGDYLRFLPGDLPSPFSVRQVVEHSNLPPRLASKMVYCLRQMGLVQAIGKQGRAWQYVRVVE
jgi:hypothetical protein